MVTQNIDGLHTAGGVTDLLEVHGSIRTATCLVDGETVELAEVRARMEAADDGVPRCAAGHPLKPGVVLFGEMLPEARDHARVLARGRGGAAAVRGLLARGPPGGGAAWTSR